MLKGLTKLTLTRLSGSRRGDFPKKGQAKC